MSEIRDSAISTFKIEAEAINNLSDQLTDDFEFAVKAIISGKGKVVVIGVGKSGITGRKIAATLTSTGTQSVFVHPGDAIHGDIGMISKDDIILAISNSGETDEILQLIPYFEMDGNILISMTGNINSSLAKHSNFHLNVAVKEEACPLNLAPTSSTTAALVMGDAIAVALMKERGFNSKDYAKYHPGGNLGKKLLTRVKDVMCKTDLPFALSQMTLNEVLFTITKSRMGIAVVTESEKIVGVITDGDIRRAIQKNPIGLFSIRVSQIMTRSPKIILPEARVHEAQEMMRINQIHALPVSDDSQRLLGIIEYYNIYI